MPEWQFPNAIADQVRTNALKRGETGMRILPADADWRLPLALAVRVGEACGLSPMNIHTSFRNAAWCDSCGAFIAIG